MKQAIRQIVGEAAVKPGKIKLDLPPLVENGNTRRDDRLGRQPDDGEGLRQGDPRLHREEPAAERHQRQARPARRQGRDPDARAARRHPDGRSPSAKCPTARSGPTRSTSSSRSAPAWRICSDGRAHPHQRSAEGQARRDHPDQDADLAHHGDRLPPRQRRPADPARHHHVVRLHLQRRGRSSRPRSIRPSPPIRSSPSTPWRPRAAPWRSSGPATTASPRTPPRKSRSNESSRAPRPRDRVLPLAAGALPSPARKFP